MTVVKGKQVRDGTWGPVRASPGRLLAIAWCAAALLAVVLPALRPSPAEPSPASATVRTFLVVALVTAVLLGPGLAMRTYGRQGTAASLGWLILPGGGLLVATGLAAWVLARWISPATTCRIALGPETLVLLGLAVASLWRRVSVEAPDVTAVAVVFLLLLIGVGRDLYSLGPPGELYGGFISRTYEATIFPDSRISYHVVQLVAHGASPYGRLAQSLLAPWTFGARGPLAGLAAAPIVLTAGARVPATLPDQPWMPFDPQGFAAYRLAIETFAAFGLLSVFSLVRRLTSSRVALFALVLTATTPFVVHETYYTWPKLIGAAMVILAAEQVLLRRPLRAGLLVGVAYLLHPSGLVWLPVLLIVALLVVWRQPDSRGVPVVLGSWAATLAGALSIVLAWQLLNRGDHGGSLGQGQFLSYPFDVDNQPAQSLTAWIDWRLQTLSDTLIPFHQLLTGTLQQYTWPRGQPVRTVVRLGLGYWGTLPLGAGILFFPMLVFGIGKALIRYPFVTVGCVLLPFIGFVVFWGSFDPGLMSQGLQAWLLGTLAIYSWARSCPRWWPVRIERWILVLRVPEIAFMILFPTLWTQRRLLSASHPVTDVVGLAAMAVGLAGLLWFTWRVTGSGDVRPLK